MKRYEFPDITTSDICFRAYGKTLSEMFENAGLALMDIVLDVKKVEAKVEREIEAKGSDLKSLMFSWLTELLFYIDSESLAFSKFEVKADGKAFTIKAKAWGEKIDQKRHRPKAHVKAATYHMMEIREEKGIWSGQVILDI